MRWSQRSAIGILLGGTSLLAQTNAPPAEPKASAASQIEEGVKRVGPIEVLTDTLGVDFNPYLSRLLQNVKQHWYELIPESVGQEKGKVVLEFAILKDGSVAGLKVVGNSGNIAMDRPAYGSITGSNPFPPLPVEFKGPYIGLRFSYYYNLVPRNSPIGSLVQDVQHKLKENLSNDKNAKKDLEQDVTALTKFLDAGSVDPSDEAAARYFRAVAQGLLGVLRKRDGLPPDTAAAEHALNDLDRVMASKADVSAWGITIPGTEYFAGGIALTDLRSESRAYSYWQRCAESGQGGCMFNLAGAYTVGLGGIQPDPAKALDLNLKVFETGTNYRCSGSLAAVAIARLIYFMGAKYPKDNDPVSWMHKSYALSDAIEARPSSKNKCDGSGARIEEFLYRLARGDRQKELLTQATENLGDDTTALTALVDYFSGTIDMKAFEATVESSKSEASRCSAYFHAMWYASLIGAADVSNRFYDSLLKFDRLTCPGFLAFARKFQLEGTHVQTIPQSAPNQSTPASADIVAEAQKLYREGHFNEAAQKYQQLLQAQPISTEVYAGLARVYLKQKKLREAHETVSKGLALADSPTLRVAQGELLFREGKLPEAESEWLAVINSGHADARAHLGLTRVSAAATQYKQAKKEIDEAHRLDPGDPEIQLYWIGSQTLRTLQNDSRRDCRLATNPVSTETDLVVLSDDRRNQIRGFGLPVVVSGQNSKLLVDTGAHGIVIDRKIAQKAALTKLSDTTVGGFGDQHKERWLYRNGK
jgi:hypothetical protein